MPENIDALLGRINQYILNPIIILLFVTALVVFFFGMGNFVAGAGSEEARATGRRHMMWGIAGMFIMIAVYGIIRIVLGTFSIPTTEVPYIEEKLQGT